MDFRSIYIFIYILKVILIKLSHDDYQKNLFFTVGFFIVNKRRLPLEGFQKGFNRGAAIVFIVVTIARFNNNI